MKDLFRYGIEQPVIAWTLFVLGIILILCHSVFLWILGILFLLAFFFLALYTWYKYQVVEGMIQHSDLRTAQKILDVGTGNGFFMTHITKAAGYVAFVTGIEDQHNDRIRQARRNAREEKVNNRVNVIHGDIRHLPFPPASFDIVTSMSGWYYIYQKSNGYQDVCDEILRVLKQNGKFILIGHQTMINQIAPYLRKHDYMKVRTSASGKWDPVKWGTLTAEKIN